MTIKNLSLVLLTALSFIWVGCDNDDISNDRNNLQRNGNRSLWVVSKALNTCKDMPMS